MKNLFSVFIDFYPFYFLVLLFVTFAALKRSSASLWDSCRRLSKMDLLLLGLCGAIGTWLRIRFTYHIDLDPYGWGYIIDSLAIRDLLSFKSDSAFLLSRAVHIPGFSFFETMAQFFSTSLFAISWFNIICSVLTIALIYLIAHILTGDRLASFIAAGMFVFSRLHIIFSGCEFPMPSSVFFVSISFLYLFLWLKNKNALTGLTALLLLFISINIKVENIAFLIVYLCAFASRIKKEGLARDITKLFKAVLLLLSISSLFWLPFMSNHQQALKEVLLARLDYQGAVLYSLKNFIFNLLAFIEITKGFPIYIFAGYVFLRLMNKLPKYSPVLAGWLGSSLLFLLYYDKSALTWNLLQMLIPVFLISGIVISETLGLVIKRGFVRIILVLAVFFFLTIQGTVGMMYKSILPWPSWVDLKKNFKGPLENDCVIALDAFPIRMPLGLLFPKTNWIMAEDRDAEERILECSGTIYYLNPIRFGLVEETDKEEVAYQENKLKQNYAFKKVADLDLFELMKK